MYTTDDDGIHFCPLHAHAEEMREALETVKCLVTHVHETPKFCPVCIIDKALAAAKATQEEK